MFCDACGAQVTANQRFCGTCGKALGAVVAGRVSSRVADHRQLLGILWTVYALFHLVVAVVIWFIGGAFLPRLMQMHPPPNMPPGGLNFLTPLFGFIGIVVLGKGLLALAAGLGLLQRSHWARLIALVSAFLALLSIPIGTAIGIYTIWALLSKNAEEEYSKLAGSGA